MSSEYLERVLTGREWDNMCYVDGGSHWVDNFHEKQQKNVLRKAARKKKEQLAKLHKLLGR